jgi:hypothetical protein
MSCFYQENHKYLFLSHLFNFIWYHLTFIFSPQFGYHTGDWSSFRELTRLHYGTVQGAYGFIDANGKQRIVKYKVGKDGFKAEGDDIPSPAVPIAPLSAPQQYPTQWSLQFRGRTGF